jgi:hypothetical protein
VRADPIGIMEVESICNCELRTLMERLGCEGFALGSNQQIKSKRLESIDNKVLTTKYLSMSVPKPAP